MALKVDSMCEKLPFIFVFLFKFFLVHMKLCWGLSVQSEGRLVASVQAHREPIYKAVKIQIEDY